MKKDQHISSFTTGSPEGPELDPNNQAERKGQLIFSLLKLIGTIYIFLLSVQLMSSSFGLLGGNFATDLLSLTTNPFIALFLGILATALIQSSSTTTTIIVALVSTGEITLGNAIPLIMGANIGTAVTSTIVSLGHIWNRDEFEGAVAGASVHDLFNIITVFLLLPLEIFTGFLEKSGSYLASLLQLREGQISDSSLSLFEYTSSWIIHASGQNVFLCLVIGIVFLFLSLRFLSYILKSFLAGDMEQYMNTYVFGKPLKSLLIGFITTLTVQSSSVTSSLIVPLVATRKISLENAFSFLIGANIGTTTTVIIAAIFLGFGEGSAALACAFTHLLFNMSGLLILFPFETIRSVPVFLARNLGKYARQSRLFGVAYVVIVFFMLPFLLIYLTTDFF